MSERKCKCKRCGDAVKSMREANSANLYQMTAETSGYKDADALAAQCQEKAQEYRKNEIYRAGKNAMQTGTIRSYEKAIEEFRSIAGWKDAEEQIRNCEEAVERLKEKQELDRIEREKRREEEKIWFEQGERRRKIRQRIVRGIAAVAAAGLAIWLLIDKVFLPASEYNRAKTALETGDVVTAYEAFDRAGKYKDSESRKNEVRTRYIGVMLRNAQVGSEIAMGVYEQDGKKGNGAEDIEWIVLDRQDERIFLISKYALRGRMVYDAAYDREPEEVCWENSLIREWLNNDFCQEAFDTYEQELILLSDVEEVQDRVFLLSIDEADLYMPERIDRICKGTEEVLSHMNEYEADSYGYVSWWLRDVRDVTKHAGHIRIVYASGEYGNNYIFDGNGVRPAMWVKIPE